MKLDEAIKHCEEVVEEKRYEYQECLAVHDMENAMVCGKCGEEHEQLAEWLKELKKFREQEPCEDCVSRQAVLEQTYSWCKDEFLRTTNPFDYLRKRINSLPPVTSTRKKGHWIMKHRTHNEMKHYTGQDEMGETHTISVFESYEVDEPYCSECGKLAGDTSQNYCCACGAEMQEVEE